MRGTEIVPAAVVDVAINVEAIGAELDNLLGEIRRGEAALETANKIMTDRRYKAGVLFAAVRKQFPARGPKAKGWGEFVSARGISLDSAARYIEIAEQVKANPELAQGGANFMDLYRTFGIASEPPARGDFPQPAVNPPQIEAPKQAETPKPERKKPERTTPEKPSKPPIRVVRTDDGGGDDGCDPGPVDDVPEVRREPEPAVDALSGDSSAAVLDSRPARPFEPALFGDKPADDEADAPLAPAWDSLEGGLDRIRGMVLDLLKAYPAKNERERTGEVLRGLAAHAVGSVTV